MSGRRPVSIPSDSQHSVSPSILLNTKKQAGLHLPGYRDFDERSMKLGPGFGQPGGKVVERKGPARRGRCRTGQVRPALGGRGAAPITHGAAIAFAKRRAASLLRIGRGMPAAGSSPAGIIFARTKVANRSAVEERRKPLRQGLPDLGDLLIEPVARGDHRSFWLIVSVDCRAATRRGISNVPAHRPRLAARACLCASS